MFPSHDRFEFPTTETLPLEAVMLLPVTLEFDAPETATLPLFDVIFLPEELTVTLTDALVETLTFPPDITICEPVAFMDTFTD